MLKINGFKPEFAQESFDNFRVFRRLMSPKLSQNQKFPKHPKLVLEYSRVCFEKFFDTNGAQHSPPSYFLGFRRAENPVQRKCGMIMYPRACGVFYMGDL